MLAASETATEELRDEVFRLKAELNGLRAVEEVRTVVTLCPRLRHDRAHPCHICTGTGLTPPTSAPGLGSPLLCLHRDSLVKYTTASRRVLPLELGWAVRSVHGPSRNWRGNLLSAKKASRSSA